MKQSLPPEVLKKMASTMSVMATTMTEMQNTMQRIKARPGRSVFKHLPVWLQPK